jgi:hypothetical protein
MSIKNNRWLETEIKDAYSKWQIEEEFMNSKLRISCHVQHMGKGSPNSKYDTKIESFFLLKKSTTGLSGLVNRISVYQVRT